jgi:hypothetical protein
VTGSSPQFEFHDGSVRVAIDIDHAAEPPIRVRAASDGVGTTFSLSVVGAQRLDVMLSAAITRAISRGLGGGR